MKFVIKHEIRGRIRFHVAQKNMSYREADILQYYLDSMKHVSSAKVNHSTCDAVVCYEGSREVMITALRRFIMRRQMCRNPIWKILEDR